MTDKKISPAQTKIDEEQLELEKKRIKNGKEIKPSKKQGKLQSGMRRFNRGGRV